MRAEGADPAHRGLMMAGFTCAQPIFAFLFGKEGAQTVFGVGRAYLAKGGDPEAYLAQLDEAETVRPELDVDAAGFVDFILPETPASHARWAAFFYGACRSDRHAVIEALVREETEWDSLEAAFDPWCPVDFGQGLSAAIDAGERMLFDGKTDAEDQRIVDDLLQANPIYDVTYPVYLPVIEMMRVQRIHRVLEQMTPAGAAQVRADLAEAVG